MKRPLTTAVVAVCFAASLSTVSANPYSAAPRIIHVPDANERASLESSDWPADDRADVREREAPLRAAPVHRPHPVVKPAKPHRASKPKRAQHRRPYSTSVRAVPPPAPVEHRAILSAPPPPIDGPTPIRPTPRFGAPVADQHAEAPAPAAPTASEWQGVRAGATTPIPPSVAAEEPPAAPAEQ